MLIDYLRADEETNKEIERICKILERLSFKNWIYNREKNNFHKASKEHIIDGSYKTKRDNVIYEVSRKYKGSSPYTKGECPVFGDGGRTVWEHNQNYFLHIQKPGDKDLEIIDSRNISGICCVYEKLEKQRLDLDLASLMKKEESEKSYTKKRLKGIK
jgi:hypothetical protein